MIGVDCSDLAGIDDWLDEEVMDMTNKMALDAHRNIVMATPRRTGTAAGGWEFIKADKPFEQAVILNRVHYIVFLINGHSKQAPSGWFSNAISAAIVFGGGNGTS